MSGFLNTRRLAAIGFVVVTTVSACGGEVTAGQAAKESVGSVSSTTPTTTTKAVDANAAFAEVEQARQAISCSPLMAATLQAGLGAKLPIMRDSARQYRDLVTAWQTQLNNIAFPADAEPMIVKLKDFTATQIKDLDAMAGAADDATQQQMLAWTNALNLDETSIRVELDKLSAALGHPEPQSFVAGNQLELAYGTFRNTITPVYPKFEEALKTGDLAGAKAANGIEQEAAQRYIETLDAIDWPPGYEDKVKTLQDALRGVIEFDRKQVDVPTTADIQTSGPEGEAVGIASETAKGALMDAVMTEALKAGALPKC